MKIIKPYFYLEDDLEPAKMLRKIERAFRKCYKSEGKMGDSYDPGFIRKKIDMKHESPVEHCSISISLICDRGITHEVVRHRIGSYSQESTRYCNYSDEEKFGADMMFVYPGFWDPESPIFRSDFRNSQECTLIWLDHMRDSERRYKMLIDFGALPQEARSVLPNSLKTDITITYNLREWRHFFSLRTDRPAHPQMRECAIPILYHFKSQLPVIFDDIVPYDPDLKLLKVYHQYLKEIKI